MPVAATPPMNPALQDLPRSDLVQDWMVLVVGAEVARARRGMRVMIENFIVSCGCGRMCIASGMDVFLTIAE